HACERLGARTHVTNEARVIASAARVILPGVGAAAHAMQRLRQSGTAALLLALTQPVLGICLGMQLLFCRSEEGPTDCLGILADGLRRPRAEPGRPSAPIS